MADAPPPKRSGPGRQILLGCGASTLLGILGIGGCAGILYFTHKSTEPIAKVGSDYLLGASEVQKEFGSDVNAFRKVLGTKVHLVNDDGDARFDYVITAPYIKERQAVVWLVRTGGIWTAYGAKFKSRKGEEITIGNPPNE